MKLKDIICTSLIAFSLPFAVGLGIIILFQTRPDLTTESMNQIIVVNIISWIVLIASFMFLFTDKEEVNSFDDVEKKN